MTLAVPFLLSERLPDPVAAHFTDGHPDESAPLQPLIRDILIVGASAWSILALLAYLRPAGSLGRRAAAGSAVALPTALGLAVLLGTVGANLDAPTWREATTSPVSEIVTLAGGALVFVFGAIAVHPLWSPRLLSRTGCGARTWNRSPISHTSESSAARSLQRSPTLGSPNAPSTATTGRRTLTKTYSKRSRQGNTHSSPLCRSRWTSQR
ncbi:hypothetical protein ACWCSH_09285 [Streptosporangium sp. NPDC001682]